MKTIVYMSYDDDGFEEAKRLSDNTFFDQRQTGDVVMFLESWAQHDMDRGLCSKYQIFDESGKVILTKANL